MKGKQWFLTKRFLSGEFKLSNFFGLTKFMTSAVLRNIPGKEVKADGLEFLEKSEVMVQTEGEFQKIKCQKIEVKKEEKIRVIMK